MQRGALSVVSTFQVEAHLFKEKEGDRLVSLGGHMHYINTEVVFNMHVRIMAEKHFNQCDVSSK